jgi:predicted nucleic acid-binding protein
MWDASVAIRHYRTSPRKNTFYSQLERIYKNQYISAIAKMEIMRGADIRQMKLFWNEFSEPITTIPFTENAVIRAFEIVVQLKRNNQLIDSMDIMIAATALECKMSLATLQSRTL